MTNLLRLGFPVITFLVIACSSTGPTAPDRVDMGDMNPVVSDPSNGAKKDPDALPTPTANSNGQPVPYPGQTPAGTSTAPTPELPKVRSKMTFFVTSTGSGALGGNLGGLAGADKKCTDLATAAGGGDHTWHAYLSAKGVNAKDRIGTGPWINQQGTTVAQNLAALHDFQFVPPNDVMIDEKGALVPGTATAILTGTKSDGTALLLTCQDWTSNNNGDRAQVGDAASATSVILGDRWNDAVKNYGCTQAQITQNKGEGRLYCFATD
jgi:hypothetical protein